MAIAMEPSTDEIMDQEALDTNAKLSARLRR
jgi:hypothetical protein